MARTDILEKEALIRKWIEEGQSKAFIAKQLNCKPETLNRYLEKMGIKYEGNQSGKGMTKVCPTKMKADLKLLKKKSMNLKKNWKD